MDFAELAKTEGGILIVDDLGTARKVLHRHLNKLALNNVLEAENVESAFKVLESKEVRLIISDWTMPKISGIEFLKQVRSEERYKFLPFILITANSAKEVVVEAATFGVSDFLAKPFTVETLRSKIENALQYETKRAARDANAHGDAEVAPGNTEPRSAEK